jgi:hypothetical protein
MSRATVLLLAALGSARIGEASSQGGARPKPPSQSHPADRERPDRAFLRQLAGSGAPLGERIVALGLLERAGTAGDLPLLCDLAAPSRSDSRVEHEAREAFERALTRILERESSPPDLVGLFGRAHPALLLSLVRAVADLGTREAWNVLTDTLGRAPEADPMLLVHLARLGEELGPPFEEQRLHRIRAYLLDNEPRVAALRSAGVHAVGISLDSLDPAYHDRFRGRQGAWQAATSGIDACRRGGLMFQVHFTVTDDNADDLDGMIDFARSAGAAVLNVFFVVCTGRGRSLSNISIATYERVLRRLADAARE